MATIDSCDLLCLDLPKAERVRTALPDLAELEPSPLRTQAAARTEIRLGVRARTTETSNPAHGPPRHELDAEDGHR